MRVCWGVSATFTRLCSRTRIKLPGSVERKQKRPLRSLKRSTRPTALKVQRWSLHSVYVQSTYGTSTQKKQPVLTII